MVKFCKTCHSPRLADIEEDMRRRMSLDDLAAKYRPLSRSSIQRHRAKHLAAQRNWEAGQDDLDYGSPMNGDTIDRLERTLATSATILEKAVKGGSWAVATGALRETRNTIEALAKHKGELADVTKGPRDRNDWKGICEWLLMNLPLGALQDLATSKGLTRSQNASFVAMLAATTRGETSDELDARKRFSELESATDFALQSN